MFKQHQDKSNIHPLFRILIFAFSVLIIAGLSYMIRRDNALESAYILDSKRDYLFKQEKYADALYTAAKVLSIRKKILGNDDSQTAESFYNLGMLYYKLKNYSSASPLFQQALVIQEKISRHDHPCIIKYMKSLADTYNSLRDYSKAKTFYEKILSIQDKNPDASFQDKVNTIKNIADIYEAAGDYFSAEPLYQQVLKIREDNLGSEHPDTASSLNNLAVLYSYMGEYDKAEPLYKRSLEIREKTLGPEHPDTAMNLNNLAHIYTDLGDYAKAEPLYKEALYIREKNLGEDHPDTASSLSSLGRLYTYLGNYSRAEELCRKAMAVQEKNLGPDHTDVAKSLNSIAEIYRLLGDYKTAEPLYERSLEIFEKTLGPDHPHAAALLNNLAVISGRMENYEKEGEFYKRSLAVKEKNLGPGHPGIAVSLNNIAGFYSDTGNYPEAEKNFKKSLSIFENALGSDHPNVSTVLKRLGKLSVIQGEYDKAHSYFIQALEKENKIIDQVMGFTSEELKLRFLAENKSGLNAFFTLVLKHLLYSSSAVKDALNIWLKRKGISLESQRRFQEALIYTGDPAALKIFEELSQTRVQLSKLLFSGPGNQDNKIWRKKISDLEEKKEKLEAELSRISSSFAMNQKISRADCEKTAAMLPDNSVLIEFARFEPYVFNAKGKESRWEAPRYTAFILHAGDVENIRLIDLGEAEIIDNSILRYKKKISDFRDIQGIRSAKFAINIHDLVFGPLKEAIGNVKQIFISPDGSLNLIPFEVLQGPDGKFLIEEYTFNYLAASRDILRFGQIHESGGKALLIGDPDFDMGKEKKDMNSEKKESAALRSADMDGFYFNRIPGTKDEVEAVSYFLGKDDSELFTGKKALEDLLMNKHSPKILHLATHGFFLEDTGENFPLDETGESMGEKVYSLRKFSGNSEGLFKNPLLRSGIALAGANSSLKSWDVEKSGGIVTAEKILGMRLRGTDMVVLSACETGLGEVQAGEGVFGLRRAFIQAGTRSLVMSMWSVPDRETRELMTEFYKNITSGKMNRCQALRISALKQMELVKERYGSANPMFWGAFVFMGEP